MRNPVKLLVESPHYVFGRFRAARALHSRVQKVRQTLARERPSLAISEHYGNEFSPLALAPSNLVKSERAPDGHVDALLRQAFSTGLQLSDEACAAIQSAARELPLEENGHPVPPFEELSASGELREKVALATVRGSSQVPAIQAVASDPVLVDVVADYLGYFPEKVSSWLFWSLKNSLSEQQRESAYQTVRFHYDVHGFNFLYVNFYLLDTDQRSGAHVLIEGSHRDKTLRHLFGSAKLDDEGALRYYGEQRVKVMEGKTGTGFFEDTACYHKALPPLERDRLMLQLRYQ